MLPLPPPPSLSLSLSLSLRLVGLVVKASASRAEDLGFESLIPLAPGFCRCRVILVSELALQWLPCQAPGVIGSVLELVGPVSVYCNKVRWTVWSATCISVWQHVKLSEQIRPLRYTRMLLGR